MLRKVTTFILTTITCCAAIALISLSCFAQTNYVRELAITKQHVYLIISGPSAGDFANSLRDEINRHNENRDHIQDRVSVVSADEAGRLAEGDKKFNDASFVYLWITKEHKLEIPDRIAQKLPMQTSEADGKISILKSAILKPANKGLALSAALVAPDADRLKLLYQIFKDKTFPRWSNMTFEEKHSTTKLAVFSDLADKTSLFDWGKATHEDVWSKYIWYPISDYPKLTPEQLDESNLAFFINRSRRNALPEIVTTALADENLKANSSIIKQTTLNNGAHLAIFSAPSNGVLSRKAIHYHQFSSLPGAPLIEEIVDLHKIGATTLMVNGAGPSRDEKDQIQTTLARQMRRGLNIPVEERDALKQLQSDFSIDDLQGDARKAEVVRRQSNLRYVWLFTILDYTGETTFKTNERDVTPVKPQTYEELQIKDDPEPKEPTEGLFAGRGEKEKIKIEHQKWEIDHPAWLRRKKDYEERTTRTFPFTWEREVVSIGSAKARGILRLVDLQQGDAPARILWEKECNAKAAARPSIRASDKVIVKGAGVKPISLPTPPNEAQSSPELMRIAAGNAATNGLLALQEEAWLPEIGTTEVPADTPVEYRNRDTKSGENGTSKQTGPVVADVIDDSVILTIGSADGVKVGDRAEVVLSVREIKNPNTGEVIEKRDIILLLKVTKVSEHTADCVVANSSDASKLAQVKPAMQVRKWYHQAQPKQ